MRSVLPWVLHARAGRPLLDPLLDLALYLACPHVVGVVLGQGAGAVGVVVRARGVSEVLQEPQLGTGDALRVALDGLHERLTDRLLVLSGDVPLLQAETLRRLTGVVGGGASAALLTAELDPPGSYGRIVRRPDGSVAEIVEAGDADPDQRANREVNAGIYAFDRRQLAVAVAGLKNDNAQGEYYLTDVVAEFRARDLAVAAVRLDDPAEMQGINSRGDLAAAERVLNRRVLDHLLDAGVTVRDPDTTWVDPRAEIGRDAVLEPGVVLRGFCHVGAGARIGANCVLDDAAVGAGETVPPLTYLTGE